MIPGGISGHHRNVAFDLGVCLVLIALVSAMGIYITAWYKFYKQ